MRHVTHHMHRATMATGVMAVVSLVLGLLLLGIALIRGDWDRAGWSYHIAAGAGLFYLLPAALLFVFSWRMDRADLWAYVCTIVLSFLLLIKFALAYITYKAGNTQFVEDPVFFEIVGRLPCIYLVVGCLNALPDVKDAFRARRRDQQIARRGFKPMMSTVQPVRLPPPPVTSIPRRARPAVPPANSES